MTFYLSGAGAYCLFLLFNKFSDRECSKTDLRSWLVLIVASTLWMIVFPISLIELTAKTKNKRSQNFDSETVEESSLRIDTMTIQ